MRGINAHLEIVELACGLGLDPRGDTVGSIVDHCRRQVESWAAQEGEVRSIGDLERVLCRRLNLVVEEVWTDGDLAETAARYTAEGDAVFASLWEGFDESTFATLIRRRQPDPEGRERYAAVIDCRGPKGARRFFSRWHEIAHLLTLPPTIVSPVHRSTSAATPTERLMDLIAGEVGFYDPIFGPLLTSELGPDGRLTFGTVDRVRAQFSPEASWRATLSACVQRVKTPVLLIEAGFGYTKREEEAFELEPVPGRRPAACLRVLRTVRNEAARRVALHIPARMRVPEDLCLHGLFFTGDGSNRSETEGVEDLGGWQHSNGTRLASRKVFVQGRLAGTFVQALVMPA